MLPTTTLEQWVVLQTIVETGSYAKAAETLNRSKTSVSYALSGLQERLGLRLLRINGRQAALTEAGENLLAQVRPLLAHFTELELRAKGLKEGKRTSLSLVVDSVFPKDLLFSAFKSFQQQHPTVQLHVTEVLRTESEELFSLREADLYLITQKPESPLFGELLLTVDFMAVAHRDHPLLTLKGPLSTAQLKAYPLVLIADRILQRVTKFQPRSLWSFTTIEAAVEAVSRGVGYGWLPWNRIEPLLDKGILCRLPLAAQQVRQTPLYLVYGNESLAYDSVVSGLAKLIRQGCP